MKTSALIALFLSAFTTQTLMAAPPNFIVIFIDDMGWEDLGYFGAKSIRTPNIDRMAAEGMRFTHFFTHSRSAGRRGRCRSFTTFWAIPMKRPMSLLRIPMW